jgi:murein DD-endopeptidase MepM/ murein hydrolase activator NlpD
LYYPNLNEFERFRIIRNRGDIDKNIQKNKVAYPFPKGKNYSIIQGYNGRFTHKSKKSKYAIDFNLQIGDTITSVDDGFVVGIVEDYSKFGLSKKWRDNDKSNYITIYHPHSGLFTQYVHLHYKGALVDLGDFVYKYQPIALSGMTGYTTTPHLHFNVKIPTNENGLISSPIEFENNIKGGDLKKGDKIKNP